MQARALAKAGAEVVAADIDDEASLTAALKGAHGAYFVTFFWAHFSPDKGESGDPQYGGSSEGCGPQTCHLVHP